jgi:hypothetical protein
MREARRHSRERAARCLLIEGDAIQKAVDSAHLICLPLLTCPVSGGATSRPAVPLTVEPYYEEINQQ